MSEHKDKFEEVWEKGDYRLGSTAQRLVGTLLDVIPEGSVINDYGSGTGRAEVELLKAGYFVNMVDIADNALEVEARAMLGKNLTFTSSDLSDLPGDFPIADWGICINVLMTVQPDKLDDILKEIRRTCRNLFFEAYDMSDHRLGQEMTTVKMNGDEWAEKLGCYWPQIESRKSPESDRRYILICRKESKIKRISNLKGKCKGETCYIVGRGPSLLEIKKEDIGAGPVICLNESIENVKALNLNNPIYSQWRNGDAPPDTISHLKAGDALLLCDNPVLGDWPSSTQFGAWPDRYAFECKKDLGVEPAACFSHLAAVEIAVKVFGCSYLVFVGFDSYLGDVRTVLHDGFIKSEYRPGDYDEQIDIIKERVDKGCIAHKWFFPEIKGQGPAECVRLNLGCGPVYEDGYINIDLHDDTADVKMNVLHLDYPDNTADEIKASHLLEHFSFEEVPEALKEWRRVLKVGGILRLNVPDLAWCLQNWLDTDEDEKFGYPLKTIFGNQANPGEFHKTGFTVKRLVYLLTQAGFEDIEVKSTWSHEQQCFIATGKKK